MLRKSAITQLCNHGPILLSLFLLACESSAAPPGTVELTGKTRMRDDNRTVADVNVVVVRVSGLMPIEIVAYTISDSTGTYRLIYDAVDPTSCGWYFAAAGRKLKLGLVPNLGARVPCTGGVHTADFLLSGSDTIQ